MHKLRKRRHRCKKRVHSSQTIMAAWTLTVAHKGPPGTSVSGGLSDNPTYCLLVFENKFTPHFEFETGARIEPQVTES